MKVIDLRPDSKLLKSNFDGYKLSLDPVPVLELEISKPDHVRAKTTSEYSLMHSELFLMQNHLVADPWLSYTAYYIDFTFAIKKIHYDHLQTGKLKPLQVVAKLPIQRPSGAGIYNCGFKFISEKFAVFSDGIGNLMIFDTGDRQKSDEWKLASTIQPMDGNGFIVQDSKLLIENGEKFIHCLLLHIEQHHDSKFFNTVEWITIKQIDAKWEIISRRTIQGKGHLYYLSLDPRCKAIVYSSNHGFKYTYDSVNPIVEEPQPTTPESEQKEASVSTFKWSQNGEDITISFKRLPEATKDQYAVKSEPTHIHVQVEDEILINADLFSEVDSELTTWSLENDYIQLNLIKKNAEQIWPYLISGGPSESVEKEPDLLNTASVSDINAQIEECDFDDDGQGNEEYVIERLDGFTHDVSHKIFLSSSHPLFSKALRPGQPNALAIRNDVDCCMWLQQTTSDDEWTLKHEGTLHAFGYIQASKRERKYLMSSPDLNTSVICESSRHLFIYKNSYNTASGLRKRTGQQTTIGQQKLVSFDGTHGDIFGVSVENDIILLLTENAICCLQIGSEEA